MGSDTIITVRDAQGGLNVLKQLVPGLGGTSTESTEPAPETTAPESQTQEPAATQQPEQVNPEKFIKGILKGLGG